MPTEPIDLTAGLEQRFEGLGHDFLAEYLARHTRRCPDDVESLSELGHLLTRLERYQEGLAVDRRLAELPPEEPTVHYNLACSLALTGARDEAFGALDRAVELGYDDVGFLRDDEDLAPLREDPRFDALLERLDG